MNARLHINFCTGRRITRDHALIVTTSNIVDIGAGSSGVCGWISLALNTPNNATEEVGGGGGGGDFNRHNTGACCADLSTV